MKLLGIVGIVSAFGFFEVLPAIGHDCYHDHHGSGCWDCGHYSGQRPMASRGTGMRGGTVALQTLEGKIAEVVYLPGVTESSGLVEIRLQLSTQNRLIRLAPTGFLKASGLLLREGDVVTVKGFPVSGMEGDLIVATELRQGEKTVSLRDTSGRPAW